MLEYLNGHVWVAVALVWPEYTTRYTGYRRAAQVLGGLLGTHKFWTKLFCYRLQQGKIQEAARVADRRAHSEIWSAPLPGRFIDLAGDDWCCYAIDMEFRLYEGWNVGQLRAVKLLAPVYRVKVTTEEVRLTLDNEQVVVLPRQKPHYTYSTASWPYHLFHAPTELPVQNDPQLCRRLNNDYRQVKNLTCGR
jgi:hypothetical protein